MTSADLALYCLYALWALPPLAFLLLLAALWLLWRACSLLKESLECQEVIAGCLIDLISAVAERRLEEREGKEEEQAQRQPQAGVGVGFPPPGSHVQMIVFPNVRNVSMGGAPQAHDDEDEEDEY